MVNRTIGKDNSPRARGQSAAPPEDELSARDDVSPVEEPSMETEEADPDALAVAAVADDADALAEPDASSAFVARPIERAGSAIGVPAWANRNAITRYLAESYVELRKTTWPEYTQARTMTLIVIGMCIGVAILLGAADYGFNHLVTWVLSLSGK